MTKTLTKQWKDGKLPDGTYYINLVGGVERVDFFDRIEWARTKDFRIEEVLAPVPSYDEYNKLLRKIERLKEQLKKEDKTIFGKSIPWVHERIKKYDNDEKR